MYSDFKILNLQRMCEENIYHMTYISYIYIYIYIYISCVCDNLDFRTHGHHLNQTHFRETLIKWYGTQLQHHKFFFICFFKTNWITLYIRSSYEKMMDSHTDWSQKLPKFPKHCLVAWLKTPKYEKTQKCLIMFKIRFIVRIYY